MITKTLLEISQTKNSGLSEIVVNAGNYTEETVITAICEIKRRNVPVSEELQAKINQFAESNNKTLEQMEKELFEKKGVKDFNEYFNFKTRFLDKSDEERLYQEKIHRDHIRLVEQATHQQSKNDVLYGGLWLAGGVIVTLVSVSSGRGGVIAYGAMIFGGIQFVRGLMSSSK